MWKIGLAVVLLLAAGLGGFWAGRGQKEVVTEEKIVETKGDEKIVFRDRIVTVTKTVKPDGTTTETTKTEEKQEDTEKHSTQVAVDDSSSTKSLASQYSLGVMYHASTSDYLPDWSHVGVTAGRRLIGDFWLVSEVQPIRREVSIGLSINF